MERSIPSALERTSATLSPLDSAMPSRALSAIVPAWTALASSYVQAASLLPPTTPRMASTASAYRATSRAHDPSTRASCRAVSLDDMIRSAASTAARHPSVRSMPLLRAMAAMLSMLATPSWRPCLSSDSEYDSTASSPMRLRADARSITAWAYMTLFISHRIRAAAGSWFLAASSSCRLRCERVREYDSPSTIP